MIKNRKIHLHVVLLLLLLLLLLKVHLFLLDLVLLLLLLVMVSVWGIIATNCHARAFTTWLWTLIAHVSSHVLIYTSKLKLWGL